MFPQKSMCKETRQFFNVCMHNGPVYMKLLSELKYIGSFITAFFT